MNKAQDPTQAIRNQAGKYAGVDEGTACTQSSFKVGKSAFLFIGEQGGRCKAMFKLSTSRVEAEEMAAKQPEDFQVGSSAWITARFSADKPLPTRLWKKWLDESYQLAAAGSGPSNVQKKSHSKVRKHK